jgi:hypothetical protein
MMPIDVAESRNVLSCLHTAGVVVADAERLVCWSSSRRIGTGDYL